MEVEKRVKGATAAVNEEGGRKMIALKSKEEMSFEVSETAARLSFVLRKMICDRTDNGIPLPIPTSTLEKVIENCNKHAETGISSVNTAASKELEKWDRKLVDGLSQDALFDLILAADYLDIDGLFDATCKKVVCMMTGKTPDQIHKTFDIQDDYTEQEEIPREYAWAFAD